MRRVALILVLVVVTAVPLVASCGDDDDTAQPTALPASDEGFVRGVCLALEEWRADFQQVFQRRNAKPLPDDVLPLFRAFATNLDGVRAVELEDVRTGWVEGTKANIAKIERAEVTFAWDPMETLPPVGEGDSALLGRLVATVPECRPMFGTPSPTPATATATGTAGTGGTLFPWSIDYARPDRYLQAGPQSTFTAENAAAVKAALGALPGGLATVGAVYRWSAATFRGEPSGGADIGKTDVNAMLASRKTTGCHDSALMVSAVLRLVGIPAVMVDTAGIQWARDFAAGRTQSNVGHVMAEAYVEGRWILLDCTSGRYVRDYDPSSPVISPAPTPGMDAVGLYVLYKGIDPASYGVTSGDVLAQRFRQFSQAVANGLQLPPTAYTWQPLP